MLHNAVESSKSSVLITDTNKMKSNKRSIQNAGLIPSWYKKYVQGIFKWQRTFHLNSLELNFEPKHSFYTILISSIKFIICMHVSTYKILVNDDLKIEFKIVSPIYRSMSTCTYQWHIGTFLTFNFDAIG